MSLLVSLSLGLLSGLLVGPFMDGVLAQDCPRGWLQFSRSCYGYFPEELNTRDAERQCSRRGAILAHVEDGSREIANFLKRRGANKDVWVGTNLFRKIHDDTAVLVRDSGFLEWEHARHGTKLPFLCEKPFKEPH